MSATGFGFTVTVAEASQPSTPGGDVTVPLSVLVLGWPVAGRQPAPAPVQTCRVQLAVAPAARLKVHDAACVRQLPSAFLGKQMKKSSDAVAGVPLSSFSSTVTWAPPLLVTECV